jgi:hypothetical protein
MGPYLTRRVAQSAWELSVSVCLSSAVACVLCKPLGRVSLAAHVDEQRREPAEARVPFLLVTYSLGKQRKVTRLQAKKSSIEEHTFIRTKLFTLKGCDMHIFVSLYLLQSLTYQLLQQTKARLCGFFCII